MYIFVVVVGRGGGGERLERAKVNFFLQRIHIFFFFGVGGGVEGGSVDGWTDQQAQTNLLLQLLSSWGHNNA